MFFSGQTIVEVYTGSVCFLDSPIT